jgi:hypothetical protein
VLGIGFDCGLQQKLLVSHLLWDMEWTLFLDAAHCCTDWVEKMRETVMVDGGDTNIFVFQSDIG